MVSNLHYFLTKCAEFGGIKTLIHFSVFHTERTLLKVLIRRHKRVCVIYFTWKANSPVTVMFYWDLTKTVCLK